MCGFAGLIAWDDRYRIQRATLDAMSAAVAHRGPDGRGLLFDEGAPQVALAHRRLAVLDPDPRADQPMTDGRRWVVFNGEIYNFRELKKEIDRAARPRNWETTGDTEVLLAAYDTWGEACLDKLNGMFAFAIWDGRDDSLFLARDRMGQKPLYYVLAPDRLGIAFASELPALHAVPWFTRKVSTQAVGTYLNWGYLPAPQTIYEGSLKLLAGHWMKLSRGKIDTARYFDPNASDGPSDESNESLADATRRLVTQSVRRQLVSDVPLGCFLSGGIDSSIVAAAMKAAVPPGQDVLTFSIGFDDPRYDETAFAKRVADHLGTKHHAFTVKPDAAEDLPKLARAFGEPFGDSSALPTHYLARETRKHVKVALSGDGGDELFGGYDRYRAMRLVETIRRFPLPVRKLAGSRLWQFLLPGSHPKSAFTRLKRLLASVNLRPADRYAFYMQMFDNPTIDRLMGVHTLAVREDPIDPAPEKIDVVRLAMATDRVMYLPDDLLAKVDRASMLHALEVRSPMLDHDLVRFAAGIPTDRLLRDGKKGLLKNAFAADLPAEVFARPKRGFALPIGDWFRGDLREMLHDNLRGTGSFARRHFRPVLIEMMLDQHERREVDHSQRLFALLMLELWMRENR